MNVFAQCRRLATVITVVALPMSAMAQSQGGGRPPEPDFDGMSKALGVSVASLKTCMPAPQKGQRPERPNASSIASCLQTDNASVTTGQVDDVLKKYGPKRS